MTDNKKLVIKINYQNKQDKLAQAETHNIPYITEWNIKRIVGAVAVLCLLIVAGVYLWINNGENKENKSNTAIVALPTEIIADNTQANTTGGDKQASAALATADQKQMSAPPLPAAVNTARQASGDDHSVASVSAGKVVRGSLAKYIRRKEPHGKIALPLQLSEHGKQTIYYFTELQDMAGKTIYHEWLYKGKSLFKRPIKITQENWRTSTHKTIRGTAPGDWTVRVIGENGEIMHQIDFKVVAANNSLAQ